MRKCIIVIGTILLGILTTTGIIIAYPIDMNFISDGLDLDTSTVEQDRTVLVILMGEPITEVIRPDLPELANFGPAVDISFGFDPGIPDMFGLILQDSVKISVLADTAFDVITDEMLMNLCFTDKPYSVVFDSNDLLFAWTSENRYFMLSGFQQDLWTFHLEVEDITSRDVPEPSTLLLFGLGLAGLSSLVRRRKNSTIILLILFVSICWAENINAQTTALITVKKEGSGTGTIFIGDQTCDSACTELSVPYVEQRALVLKVLPAEDAYFIRWKKTDGNSSQGTVQVHPGETITAVFGKKWTPFDPVTPATSPVPPEIQVVTSTVQEVVVDVEFPGMEVGIIEQGKEAYQTLSIQGCGAATTVGAPQLPMIGRFIALPVGATASIDILESSFQELKEYMVYPAQEPLPDVEGAIIPPFTIDSARYQQDAFYPSNLAELEGPFIIRGSSVVILRMSPVQFNPVQRTLRVYSHLRVKVSFDGGADYFIEDRVRSVMFDSVLDNLALNADTALSSGVAPDVASDTGNSLLIVTHPNFLDAANALARWKVEKGIPTEVRTTAQTGDAAAAIQQFIRNAYTNWSLPPTYVLLIGDAEFIPCHYVTNHPYNSKSACNNCQGDIGTDLYYATVAGTDYLPDISIGRLSVDTLAQANTRVNNIINYEKNPSANTNFYNSAVVAAYFQDNDNGPDGFEDRRFVQTSEDIRNYLVGSGYTVDRIYFTENTVKPTNWSTSYWPGTGAAIPTALQKPVFPWNGNRNDITNAVNAGRFLLTHRDHGATWGWDDPQYTTGDVQALNNGNQLPVVWSLNCQTGWFDNETDNPNPNNTLPNNLHFSEAWERNPNGGAIGIVAATRVSYSGWNDRFAGGLMDAIWPNFDSSSGLSNNFIWEMGSMLNYGKLYMAQFYPVNATNSSNATITRVSFEMFHWFGDPTLQIWTGVPQTLSVSHPATLPAGSAFIGVNVDQADALISISRNGVIVGKALSKSGMTTVSLSSFLSSGDVIQIVVTKHNFRPYEGTVNIVPFSSPCQVINGNDNGSGSLRQVLADAGTNTCTAISFAGGVSEIKLESQLEIPATSWIPTPGMLTIGNVAPDGTPISPVTISGQDKTRVFYVDNAANVAFQNLVITKGKAIPAVMTHIGIANSGGGIYNEQGSVTIGNSTIVSNNSADSSGGGISNYRGTLTVNGTISYNTAPDGGGIYNADGTVTITNSGGVAFNTTDESGGGIYNSLSGTVTIANGGIVGGNFSRGEGGGITNNPGCSVMVIGTVSGNNAVTWSGGGIRNGGTLTIANGGLVDGNNAGDSEGGGISNYGTTIIESQGSVRYNSADNGGGIENSGTLIVNGTVSKNIATPYNGGGIINYGEVTVNGTVTQNQAYNSGGGIYNTGNGAITITSTGAISYNTTSLLFSDGMGGGIYNDWYATTTIESGGTINNNSAVVGGGIYERGWYSFSTNIVGATSSSVFSNTAKRPCKNYYYYSHWGSNDVCYLE